jgi:endonuclease V-like protein UPF0215 family
MKSQAALVVGIGIGMLAVWAPTPVRPAHLIATAGGQHEQHQGSPPSTETAASKPGNMMMGNMMASDAKLEELVKKMNDATGQAKTEAIAEVVTALVQQHRAMHGMMAGMTPGKMGGMHGTPAQPGK